MEFSDKFELEGVTAEETWLALSDPIMIKNALPGCQFLVEVDDPDDVDFDALAAEHGGEDPSTLPDADPETVVERAFEEGKTYAALMELKVGSVNPRFETLVTIDRRDFPEMDASGRGNASDSSFEMDSGMTLVETDGGVEVQWWAEADVFGRIAQMGQRMLNPVAKRVVNRFFKQIENQLNDVSGSSGLRDRISGLF